jgi:hypothetical protein
MNKPGFLDNRGWLYGLAKALAFGCLFRFVHFWYVWWPNEYTALVSGTGEAVFQHFKIGFWSWLLVCLAEAALVGRRIGWRGFVASRLLSLSLVSWINFILWFTVLVGGPLPTGGAEIAIVISMVFVMGLLLWIVEKETEGPRWSPRGIAGLVVVVALTAFVLVAWRWQDQLPWCDVFAAPLE